MCVCVCVCMLLVCVGGVEREIGKDHQYRIIAPPSSLWWYHDNNYC